MTTFEEAFQIVINSVKPLDTERVTLFQAAGRVLREDIFSDVSMPPFDKSAMDGYACRRADLDAPLTIVETIPAGYLPGQEIGEGQCAKIMTGAKVPVGADTVVMVEHTRIEDNRVVVVEKSARSNICLLGEDVRAQDLVLSAGVWIGPAMTAMLAAVGCTNPRVAKRPRVGILATGSELVEPDQRPNEAQIRNSNSAQLFTQTRGAGAIPSYFGIAPDELNKAEQMIRRAVSESDVVILSGGVSMGDFDFIPDILKKIGVSILFHKVAMKPGKPTVFGTLGDKTIFGLPGNPASAFVVFELMVRPALSRLMGTEYRPEKIRVRAAKRISRKQAERLETIPVKLLEDGRAEPISYHGSAHIHAFAAAHGMMQFPVGISVVEKDQEIDVMLLQRGTGC